MSDFFNMGGYALYVWGSFGLTAVVMAAEVWQVRANKRAVIRNLLNETESQDDTSTS